MKPSLLCASLLAAAYLSVPGVSAQSQSQATACSANDLTALNYALTLEHLEATFYSTFQSKYSASDFTLAGYDQYVYSNFALIAAHEAAHVSILSKTISGRGDNPVPACIYNFTSIDSVHAYVAIAQVLENTGVSAYDGAINTFTDPALAQAAATIATIEARHAAYLNQLNVVSPFPSAFDNATAPSAVVAAVLKTGLITSCPYPLNTPVVLVPTAQTGAAASSNPANAQPLTATQSANDLLALNYALTLEHLEASFYTHFQDVYSAGDFNSSGFGQSVYDEFTMIEAHEQAHVSALTQTIQALGGTAVPACVYNFTSIQSVKDYIAAAKLLENTGVSAYDGAVNTISSTELRQIAATIATVEARHAAVLNALNSIAPFPDQVDTAIVPADIVAAVLATGFVASCPYNLTVPVLLPTAGDCLASSATGTASGPPGSTAPDAGASTSSTLPAPSTNGGASGVCPSVQYQVAYTRATNDFRVTFTLNSTDPAKVGVQFVDVHVSINQPFGVDPSTGAYTTQFNYRMNKQSDAVFVYDFPGTDGITIPVNEYVEYFFTYFTTFGCNGNAGTLGKNAITATQGSTIASWAVRADAISSSNNAAPTATQNDAMSTANTVWTAFAIVAAVLCSVVMSVV